MTHLPTAVRRRAAVLLAAFLLAFPFAASAQQAADTELLPDPDAPTPTAFDAPDLVERYQATITPEDLAAHLYVFASDYFEGRETTTRGQKLAAYYLAGQYRKMGIEPKGTIADAGAYSPEAYFQPFDVYGQRLHKATLTATVEGETVATETFGPAGTTGDALLGFGGSPVSEGSLVFAGYGIADDELGYDDFAAIEAAGIEKGGKWLLILRDEPLRDADTSLLPTNDGAPSNWSQNVYSKIRAAFDGGIPAGILLVDDIGPRAEGTVAERAAAAAAAAGSRVGNLSLNDPGPNARGRTYPPMYRISSDLANKLLAPTGRTVAELQASIDEKLEPVVFEVPSAHLTSQVENETFAASTENVLAFIEGSDPLLKDEVVVISSHYDHIGVDASLEGDQINNGADDDGSGTVSVLEIAEAFMQAKRDGVGPRRSILFLNVTGEEKGLLGSAYYADAEPVLPIEKTVTNLNIDMVGRFDPSHPSKSENYVYIIGSNLISQELHDINQRVNALTGVDLELDERYNSKDDPNRFYRRSDHWNFGEKGIPFIFFFTGTHEDYHQPGDEPHKIEYDRMARIARLIFATAWQVANQDTPPEVSGTGFN